MSPLFQIVYNIALDSGLSIGVDEGVFLHNLYQAVKKQSALQKLVPIETTTLQEAHLPLVARCIERTIGLIDEDDTVIYIPNQWFASNQADDYVEVIRKSILEDGTVVYEQDFDEKYVAKYEEYIQQHRCSYFTDNTHIRLDDGSSTSVSSSLQSISHENIEHIVNDKMKKVSYDKNFENRFLDIWGTHYYFPDKPQNGYPHIHDEHFHTKLYDQSRFHYANMLQQDTTHTLSVPTYKDHQQLMRNFISPITPYHSLLLIHATGTGKTLTTFAMTEQFRNITHAQNKKIHITCPRREICNEFISYLKPSLTETSPVKEYIQSTYAKNIENSKHDFEHTSANQYALNHYRIENYYAIFPKSFFVFANHLKRLVYTWRVILPIIHTIQRKEYGFLIVSSNIVSDDIRILQNVLDELATTFTKHFNELWKYNIEVVDENVNIYVTETHTLHRFEKHIVQEYADTIFVVDEAHRLVDTLARIGGETTEDYENNNWRNMLYIVISILRFHRCRMRVLLLTATPMINSDDDFFVLLNLLIYNDGIQNEKLFPIMKNVSTRDAKKRRHSSQFKKSVQARVSYFKKNEGKPNQLFAEDVFYNVLPHINPISVLQGRFFPILLIPDRKQFLEDVKTTHTQTIVYDQTHTTSTKHHIPLHELMDVNTTCSQQVYVYILLNPSLSIEKQIKWCSLCGSYLQAKHTPIVVGLHQDKKSLHVFADNVHIQQGLFAHTSIKHPLFTKGNTKTKRSIYHTMQQPCIYTHNLNNMDVLLKTYMSHTPNDLKNLQYNPTVIATPMQNRAVFTEEKDKSLKYNLANQLIHNWNVNDKTDTVYQPKIDTMLSIMEILPGNILIYTNEVRLDAKNKTGARTLHFLKRRIKEHYSQNKNFRLHKATIEILHKETLHHLNDNVMTTELNERIQVINQTLLAKRNDVILIGSKEIMEGLTMNEIRQVHILDPAWNIAQMEQVMGRAIRIGNHKKHIQKQLRNVSCFLHISVPEKPFYNTGIKPIIIDSLNAMERSFSDIHRYRLMQHKIKDVRETDIQIQSNAIDTIFLGEPRQQNICVLSDGGKNIDNHSWKIVQHTQSSHILQDTIASLRSAYLNLKTNTALNPVHRVPESMRNEIDWFKQSIPILFDTQKTYFQTFDEICRTITPYGHLADISSTSTSFSATLDVAYYKHFLQKNKHTQSKHPELNCNTQRDILEKIHLLSPLLQQQLLLSILLCQYKWYVRKTTDLHCMHIHIDEISVLTHTKWREYTKDRFTTFSQLTQANVLTTHLKKILQTLNLNYVIPIHTKQSQTEALPIAPTLKTLKQKHIYGIHLQNIHNDAVERALQELITQTSPIQMNNRMYYVKFVSPFYTLVPFHIPKSYALWNVSMTEETSNEYTALTPYSVSLEEEKEHTISTIQLMLNEILQLANVISTHLRTHIPEQELHLYSCEYAFDSMTLQKQDLFLQYIAIHGLDSIFKPENSRFQTIFRNALSERFIEKGKKQTEVFPAQAQQILKEFFPNSAGRMFFKFPKNPATETCSLSVYEKFGKKKHSQIVYEKKQLSTKQSLYKYAIQYFSPIPVRNTSDMMNFYSSPNIHNVSTQPIKANTILFGYNDVLNFKHKLASHLQMKVCVSNIIRDVPIDSPDVEQHLEEYQCQHNVFKTTLREAEELLVRYIRNDEMMHVCPNVLQCCKYIMLRHTRVFLRFFYPGIVTKHPSKEYYASYKHTTKKKLIG